MKGSKFCFIHLNRVGFFQISYPILFQLLLIIVNHQPFCLLKVFPAMVIGASIPREIDSSCWWKACSHWCFLKFLDMFQIPRRAPVHLPRSA